MTGTLAPFQRWVDNARPREQLWRTAAGVAIIAAIWMIWSVVVILAGVFGGVIKPGALQALYGAPQSQLGYFETAIMMLVLLATLWGFTFGVWLALRLLHRRSIGTLAGPDGRFSLKQLGAGAFIAAAYLAVSISFSLATGNTPRRSEVDVASWLLMFVPFCVVIFTQAASEELMFRGYLPQQLAARFPAPLVWGLLPSTAFGLLHAGNAPGSLIYAAYYVVIATVAGLVMMAMVWRTGSVAAAIGFHFVNNLGALTIAGSDGGASSLSLFVWSPDELMRGASLELLLIGLVLAFVLSPWAPLPKGQRLVRRNETRAAP